MVNHFEKVFNRDTTVYWEYANKKKSKRVMYDVVKSLDFTEFKYAIEKLTWNKAPIINDISLNALNTLDDDNT